jgi:glucose-1-phosphate adenylyltransferase
MQNKELFSRIYNDKFIKTFIRGSGSASIGKHGKIINSFISDNCIIHGTVRNSIIFPDVEISEKTVVSNSILLPHNRVGFGTRITKSVIDELILPKIRDEAANSNTSQINIGSQCYIGSENEQMKNNDFPRSIYRSITLIGKNCFIPDGSRIGGACYVSSGRGRAFFSKSKYLYDGLSLVK